MGLTADTIGIDLEVRMQQVRQDLARGERLVDQSAKRMGRSLSSVGMGGLGGRGSLRQLLPGIGVAAGIDRTLAGVNAGFDAHRQGESIVRAIQMGFESAIKSLPILGESFNLGRNIQEWAQSFDREAMRSKFKETVLPGILGKRDAFRFELADDDEKANMQFRKRVDEFQEEIDKAREAFHEVARNPQETLDFHKYTQEIITLNRLAAEKERDTALNKDRGKPIFDSASTLLGTFKAPHRGGGEETAKEDTAKKTEKNTKKTAAALERLLRKGGAIVAFS